MFTNSGHKLSREKIQFATPRHLSRVRNGLTRKVSHPMHQMINTMHLSSLSSVYNIFSDVYDFDFGIGVYVFLDPNRSPLSLNPSPRASIRLCKLSLRFAGESHLKGEGLIFISFYVHDQMKHRDVDYLSVPLTKKTNIVVFSYIVRFRLKAK
jgi:hypothetical protein